MVSRHSTSPLTVRERFSYRPHIMAGLAAFLVTGLTVHFFAQHGFRQGTTNRGAPICVSVEMSEILLAGIKGTGAEDTTKALVKCLHRPELLRQAWEVFFKSHKSLSDTPAFTVQSWEQFTTSIKVKANRTSGGCRVELQLNSLHPREAGEYLTALIEQFVRQCHIHLAESAERQAMHSQEEFRQAKVEYREAQERLNQFETEFIRQESERQHLQQAGASEKKRGEAPPSPVENPRWVDLQKRLETARNREAILLKKMTPAHPEILVLRQKMQELEEVTATTPRWLPSKGGESPHPNPLPKGEGISVDDPPAMPKGDDLVQKMRQTEVYRQLQQDVEEAAKHYLGKRDAVQTADIRLPELPPESIHIRLPTEVKSRSSWNFRQFGLSLSTSLAMAVGVCLVSVGAALEPLVARLADLERLVLVPILGVIPLRGSAASAAVCGRKRLFCRYVLIISGLLLVFGATAGILMAFYHYALV